MTLWGTTRGRTPRSHHLLWPTHPNPSRNSLRVPVAGASASASRRREGSSRAWWPRCTPTSPRTCLHRAVGTALTAGLKAPRFILRDCTLHRSVLSMELLPRGKRKISKCGSCSRRGQPQRCWVTNLLPSMSQRTLWALWMVKLIFTYCCLPEVSLLFTEHFWEKENKIRHFIYLLVLAYLYLPQRSNNFHHSSYSFPANIYPHCSAHLPYVCRNIWHLVRHSIYVIYYIFKAFYKQRIIMGISSLSNLVLCIHPTLYI